MTKTRNSSIILLYIFRILNLLAKFLITIVVTRKLNNPALFGKYSFFLTVTTYIAAFFGFGFETAAARLLAINSYEKNRFLSGALYVLYNIFSVIYLVVMLLVSWFFLTEYNYLLLLSIISHTVIYTDLLSKMLSGTNKIKTMIALETSISLSILVIYTLIKMNYYGFLLTYFGISLIANNIFFFFSFKPVFSNVLENINIIWRDVKAYGFNTYFGRVITMSTYNSDKLILKHYSNETYVGYYNLGFSCLSPIIFLPVSLMTGFFKELVHKDRIPRKIFLINTAWLIISSLLLASIGPYIFTVLFGVQYSETANLLPLFAVVAFLSGFFQPFNSFFAAKGFGKELRNIGILLSVSNLALNFLIIPRYKLHGALYATILVQLINNASYLYYYKKATAKFVSKI